MASKSDESILGSSGYGDTPFNFDEMTENFRRNSEEINRICRDPKAIYEMEIAPLECRRVKMMMNDQIRRSLK